HFIHSRFYCYSYVFGQLLVLALYRMYREQGRSFVPKYLALLEAGGSDTPEALLEPLGVNIHDAAFWQKGFDEIKGLVSRLQKLLAAIKAGRVLRPVFPLPLPTAAPLAAQVPGAARVEFDSRDENGGKPVRLFGWFFAAKGGAKAPAVVALHGCGGLY